MPPAARGALFEKTAPLDPPQKLLIKQKFCGGPGGGFSKEPPGRRRQVKFLYKSNLPMIVWGRGGFVFHPASI